MTALHQFFGNHIAMAVFLAWIITQLSKVLIHFAVTRRLDWSYLNTAGGMPSSHSALAIGLVTGVGMVEGLDSTFFAISLAFAGIVIYDALGVRRDVGDQARIINQIIDEIFQGHELSDEKVRVLMGHTPLQVIVGSIMGFILTLLFLNLWNG